MGKIKRFDEFHVNEIISKDTLPKDRIKDQGLQELLGFFVSQIAESPIAFEVDGYSGDYFNVKGPFGITIYVNILKKKAPGTMDYEGRYVNAGYYVSINKWRLENETAKGLIKELKKTMEFKYFIKGKKTEKLAADRIKKILQRPYSDENLIEYLYYIEPTSVITIKSDNSGPWATSGSSIHKYIFNLSEPINAWKEHFNKGKLELSDDEPYETMERIKDALCKKRGYISGGISSNSVEAYDVQMPTVSITVKNHTYYN